MDRTQTRASNGKTLSAVELPPLKPTPGLDGPPVPRLKIESEAGPHNALFVLWVTGRILN
jgi:hypothetical protein